MKTFAVLFALATPSFASVISLPGTTETATWDLNSTNYPSGIPLSYGQASNPWAAPVAPTSGTATAVLDKIAGGGYLSAGGFMYTAGSGIPAEQPDGLFRITNGAPMSSLETIVFYGNISEDNSIAPTLSYNGGAQALAPVFARILDNGGTYPIYAWQWDLRGAGAPVNSYAVTFGGHFATPSLTVLAGDTFVQAIPEPSSLMAGLAALGLTLTRRRRA